MRKDAFDFEQIFVEHTENNDHISDIQLENQTCYLKKFLPMNKDGLKDYDIINVICWDKERHMVLMLCSWHNTIGNSTQRTKSTPTAIAGAKAF